MAATAEESTPPDMATAMAGESNTLIVQPNLLCFSRLNFYFLFLSIYKGMRSVALLHSHSGGTDG
jgi:hypothetical protein